MDPHYQPPIQTFDWAIGLIGVAFLIVLCVCTFIVAFSLNRDKNT